MVLPAYQLVDPASCSARESFVAVWDEVQPQLNAMKSPGFLLVASHRRWGTSSRTLPLLNGRSSHRIIGRHSRCDLRLNGEADVSLRHLLVSAWMTEEQAPTLRVLDLGARLKPRLEDGRSCSGFRANGSCSIAVGNWWLHFLFADGRCWPRAAEDAWDALGERIVSGVLSATPRPEFPHRIRPRLRLVGPEPRSETSTLVVCLEGPEMLADLPPDCGDAIGYLTLCGDRLVNLSPVVLERGVLVGRYERCVGGKLLQQHTTISRVHLCLVTDPTGLWAIDTNSSNGTWAQGGRVKAVRLGLGLRMQLGRAELNWKMYR